MLWPHHSSLLRKMSLITSWVTMMMIITVWISVPCPHEYHAAATPVPSDPSTDIPPSGSDPALSGSGHLSSFHRPPESVDHADGTSGSSGELEPWILAGDLFNETDMLSGGGAREDEPKAETSSGDVQEPEEPRGGHAETVMVEKREDGGAGAVSPVTQKSLYGTLATGETVSSLLPDGQTMTSTEPSDKARETEKKSGKNEHTSSVTPQHDGQNLITDGKEYDTTTKKNGSVTGSSPPDKWSGSTTPVDQASPSSSSDSESKVSAGENPVEAGTVPPGPSLPLHSPKPSAEDSPSDDTANETSAVTMNTPTKDHTVVTKRDSSASHWSPMTGHSDPPVFDPSSSGNPETFTFSKAPTELLTTADDLFTTKLDTSRSDRSSPDFKVTSDEALMSSGSRTRRETRFTDGETTQHTTADFSSTLPSNMESTSVVKSTLLPTASSGSQMTSGELSDFPTESVVGTTAMVQTSPSAAVGRPCVSNQSCYHLDHAVCLEGTCSCKSGYYGDLNSDACFQEPYGLTVTADSKTCLNLRWDGGDHDYNVTVTSSVAHDATQSEVTKPKDLQMCHFSPGALLKASVVLSVGGEAKTASLVLEPEAPTQVEVSSVNHTCVTFTWRPGPGHTDLYILKVSYAISGLTTTTTTTTTTWTDCGLAPGTSFRVEVISASHGTRSQTQGDIGPDSTVPSQPVDGVGQRNDADPSHCVDLQWTAGPGYRERFHLAGPASVGNTTTNSTAATVCSLQPGSLYTFSISASSDERYSQPLVVDACTDPKADWNLRTEQVEATQVTLVWDPPFRDAAVRYVIRGNHSDDNDATIMEQTDQTSATVTGLMSGTLYSFSLTAEFCNRTSLAVPLTVRTSFSALKWANVSAEGRTLEVRWETEEQGGEVPIWLTVQYRQLLVFREVVHTSPQFIHTNYSGACFKISLQVANRSQVTTLHKSTEPAAPDKVQNLQAQRLPNDRRALNVTWSPPAVTNGIISHYNVSVRGQRGFQETSRLWHCQRQCQRQCHLDCRASAKSPDLTESDANDEHWVEVDELSEYENYEVEVTAYTSAGGGPSSLVVVGGQLLDTVVDLRVDTPNASCLTLTWSPPENAQAAPTYHVDYYQTSRDHHHDNHNDNNSGPVILSDTHCRLCGLQYWTSYQVSVTAVDDQGRGKTDTRRQRTAEHEPGEVANVSVSVATSIYEPRRLDVSWSAPVHPYGVIRNYFITVRDLNTSELIERRHQQPEGLSRTRFNQSFSLVADHYYRVQVFGATGAGNGSTVERAQVMPAGALPPSRDRAKVSNLDPGVTSLQAEIPTSLLCNFSYGMPVHAGYIVFRPGEKLTGISSKGVSLGPTPVVTSHWTPSHTSFFVDMDVKSLCPSAIHGGRHLTVPLEDASCREGGQQAGGEQKKRRRPPRCSGPLAPSTHYHLLVVYCTSRACTYTLPAPVFTTPSQPEEEDSSATGVAAGVAVVLLLLLLGAGAAFYWVYKKKQRSRTAVIPLRSPEGTECREAISRSRPVALERFLEHVQQLHRDSNLGFSEEYKTIKDNSPSYSVRAAELTPCKPKNRYTNILPWDRSRVKLIPTDDEEGSDYINASYLPGENHQREFIAAQGPLPSTVDDFWRMTWENRVCVMVMLTQCIEKGKTKCDKYWPDEGVQTMYGDLMVQVRSQSVLPDYIIRVIDVKLGNQSRMIKHFHFMRWPDHGCPEKTSMLLNFVSSVRAHMPHSGAGPTLVHCSAGVGRTGTFIALDRLLLQIRQRSHVDIFNLVFAMREHRMQMVQNENQYVYIHDCLADALTKDQESDEDESEDDEDEHVYGNC